jgi:hypothetical protein
VSGAVVLLHSKHVADALAVEFDFWVKEAYRESIYGSRKRVALCERYKELARYRWLVELRRCG